MHFLYDILHISAARKKYNSVKDDPELSDSCWSYGAAAVVNALLSVAAAFGFKWGYRYFLDGSVGTYILAWALVVIFGVVILTQVASAAINTFWQLRLNKKRIRYVALLSILLSIVGIILVLLLF